MKTTVYTLIAFSAILLVALLYTTVKLQNTEMRRRISAAKAAARKREIQQLKRQSESCSALLPASVVPDGVQSRFDEYEQTIEDLERQLDAAKAENESLKRTKERFTEYIAQAVEAGRAHANGCNL